MKNNTINLSSCLFDKLVEDLMKKEYLSIVWLHHVRQSCEKGLIKVELRSERDEDHKSFSNTTKLVVFKSLHIKSFLVHRRFKI